jgi:peptidoglycan/LPS O-acetylase OafA/YrhL
VGLLAIATIYIYLHEPYRPHVAALVNNVLQPIPIGVLYWGLLRERTVLSRVLASNTFGLLGRSSYSFYLLHELVIDYMSVPLLLPWMARWLCVLLTLVVTWLASIALYAYFEEPVNLYLRRLFHSKDRSVGMQATLYR